jgi:hypothetical protein
MSSPKSEHTAAKIGCLATIAAALITTAGAFLVAYLNRSPTSNRNINSPIATGETNSNVLTNRNDSKVFTPAPTAGRPVVEPSNSANSDLGLWDFPLYFDRIVGKDGFIKNQAGVYNLVLHLRQDGTSLTGNLQGSMYNNNRGCGDGTIIGTIQGDRVSFDLIFGDNINCCPGEKWKFNGTVKDNLNAIEGSETPVGLPISTSCQSLYSTFVAHRRREPS